MKEYYVIAAYKDNDTLFINTRDTLTNDLLEAWRTEDLSEAEALKDRYTNQYKKDLPEITFEVCEITFKKVLYLYKQGVKDVN